MEGNIKKDLLNFMFDSENPNELSYDFIEHGGDLSLLDIIQDENINIENAFLANHTYYLVFNRLLLKEVREKKEKVSSIFDTLAPYPANRMGVMDIAGKIIIGQQYRSIEQFVNGILKVKSLEGKYGLINLSGDKILETIYDNIYPLGELLFAVSKDNKVGFCNLKGEIVIPMIYDDIELPVIFYNGLACVNKDGKFGYINHNNEAVLPFEFMYNTSFKNGYTIENEVKDEEMNGHYIHRYAISVDGSMELIDSEFYEEYEDLDDEDIEFWQKRINRINYDKMDAYEGDESNLWNTD